LASGPRFRWEGGVALGMMARPMQIAAAALDITPQPVSCQHGGRELGLPA